MVLRRIPSTHGVSLLVTFVMALSQGTESQTKAVFISRLGIDTVAVERFTRTSASIEGDIVAGFPRATITHYAAMLGPNGTIVKFDLAIRPVAASPDAPPLL